MCATIFLPNNLGIQQKAQGPSACTCTTSYGPNQTTTVLPENATLASGKIKAGGSTSNNFTGHIYIKAYLDAGAIAISDTYDANDPGTDNMGTTNSKAQGKTVITTPEWNALQNSGVSFKVKVEANE